MNSRIVLSSVLTILVIAATVSPGRARAQVASSSAVVLTKAPILATHTSTRSQPGPVMAPAGAARSMAAAPVNSQTQTRSPGEGVGKTRAMMGVGLAAIIIGVVVGGDVGTVFIVGGGVVGLIGLYRFMK